MSEAVLIKLPDMLREEADFYVESGFFENRSELIREAVREFLEKMGKDKQVVAVDMYRAGKISLGRAAEISGVGYEKMKEILSARGIPITRGPVSAAEAQEEYAAFKDK